MSLKKSDDAISPVIGVMLILVVTVVIAAAATIFATGNYRTQLRNCIIFIVKRE